MSALTQLFLSAAVVMIVSHTVSKEKIFEPLRKKLGEKETWFGYLVSCPYCLSHWVAFFVVTVTGARFFPESASFLPRVVHAVTDWFFSALVLVAVAAGMRVVFFLIDEGQGLVRRENKIVDQELQEESHSDSKNESTTRRMQAVVIAPEVAEDSEKTPTP